MAAAVGKALEVLGIDPKYCTNCICRMMCKGKVCELARTMVGLEVNPDEVCKDLALEPNIATFLKGKDGKQVVEQIVGFTWMCRRKTECDERGIWCQIKEERIQQIFFQLIRGYNDKKDFQDHALILPGDLVLLVNFNAGGGQHGWSYRVIQAEKW
jgi:hypothetical protein